MGFSAGLAKRKSVRKLKFNFIILFVVMKVYTINPYSVFNYLMKASDDKENQEALMVGLQVDVVSCVEPSFTLCTPRAR